MHSGTVLKNQTTSSSTMPAFCQEILGSVSHLPWWSWTTLKQHAGEKRPIHCYSGPSPWSIMSGPSRCFPHLVVKWYLNTKESQRKIDRKRRRRRRRRRRRSIQTKPSRLPQDVHDQMKRPDRPTNQREKVKRRKRETDARATHSSPQGLLAFQSDADETSRETRLPSKTTNSTSFHRFRFRGAEGFVWACAKLICLRGRMTSPLFSWV
jgi:hypothetical protein